MMLFGNNPGLLTIAVRRYMSFLLALCFSFACRGQEISWKADRTSILIGQTVTCRLEMPVPADDASFTLTVPDSIPHFELVAAPTQEDRPAKDFRREWVFTSFDSGSWILPAFPVLIRQGTGTKTIYTDSIRVDVLYDRTDSTGTLRDIKTVIEVPVADYTWYYIAGGLLLLALLSWLVFRYFRRKKGLGSDAGDSRLSPYEELMNALDALSAQPLRHRSDHVAWHAAMSGMVRRYSSRRSGTNRLSATTGDLLFDYGREGLDAEGLSMLAEILRTGDAVKFAKYEPTEETTRLAASRLREVAGMIERLKSGH